jgi:hypothetical protein
MLFLRFWDLVGVFAYGQIVAFLESSALLLILLLLSAALPELILRRKFVAQGSVAAFTAIACALVLQYKPEIAGAPGGLFMIAVLYLGSNGLASVLIHRSKRLEEVICAFAERLTALLYIYIAVTLISIVIVVLRNV